MDAILKELPSATHPAIFTILYLHPQNTSTFNVKDYKTYTRSGGPTFGGCQPSVAHLNCAVCYNRQLTLTFSAVRPEGRGSAAAYQPNYTLLHIRRFQSHETSTCTCVQKAYTEEVMSVFLPAVRMFQLDHRLPNTNHSAVAFYSRDAFLKISHKSKLA